MPFDLIDRILEAARVGETTDWEFKSAKGGFEQYHRGGVSECRNKSLQKMFALIGRGEQAGSGADKIRTGWRLNRWRAPRLECHNRPSRVDKDVDSSHKNADSSHLKNWEQLETVAHRVSKRKRSSPQDIRKTVIILCKDRYLTAEQISQLMKRNVDGLRNRYLSPMVGEKLLKLRYPEAANRPSQAYTATEESS